MGFGGFYQEENGENLESENNNDTEYGNNINEPQNTMSHPNLNLDINTGDIYNAATLAKLKSEQKTYIANCNDESNTITMKDHSSKDTQECKQQQQQQQQQQQPSHLNRNHTPFAPEHQSNTTTNEESYIPLGSTPNKSKRLNNSSFHIMTGDEAMSYIENDSFDNVGNLRNTNHPYQPKTEQDKMKHALVGNQSGINIGFGTDVDAHDNIVNSMYQDDDDIDEGISTWEEEISRRAGIDTKNNNIPTISTSSTPSNTYQQPTDNINTKFVSGHQEEHKEESPFQINIRSSILSALESLNETKEHLLSDVSRKRHEYELDNKHSEEKEQEIRSAGKAFEEYQLLRSELTNCVGAMREVEGKVAKVEKALRDMTFELCMSRRKRWFEYEEDCVRTLSEKGLLQCKDNSDSHDMNNFIIIGRQIHLIDSKDNNEQNQSLQLDEFGRNVSSMETIARTRRNHARYQAKAESRDRRHNCKDNASSIISEQFQGNTSSDEGDDEALLKVKTYFDSTKAEYYDSDMDVGDDELMDREERRLALSDAANMALDGIDQTYVSPSHMITIFSKWKDSRPDDYRKVCANSCLSDLLSIILRYEFCRSFDPCCFIRKQDNQKSGFHWGNAMVTSLNDIQWLGELKKMASHSSELPSIVLKNASDHEHTINPNYVNPSSKEESTIGYLLGSICVPLFQQLLEVKNVSIVAEEDSVFAYNPFSRKETLALTSYVNSLFEILPERDMVSREKVGKYVIELIEAFIKNLVVPRVNTDAANILTIRFDEICGTSTNHKESAVIEAIIFATFGQLFRFTKLMANVVKYWLPLINYYQNRRLAQFMLVEVISNRILPIIDLFLITSKSGNKTPIKLIFRNVLKELWNYAVEAGWKDSNDLEPYIGPLCNVMKELELLQ